MDKQTLIDTENKIRESFKQKRIRYMFHMCGGNEDSLIRIFEEIRDRDWVFSTHRSHYHALLKGMSPDELIERVELGSPLGICDAVQVLQAGRLPTHRGAVVDDLDFDLAVLVVELDHSPPDE